MPAQPGEARIGTSGWNYKHWREIFYPKGVPQRQWLHFFSGHYDTVELNTTFYRIPKAESVQVWNDTAPAGFLFAAKLWKGITHYKKLLNAEKFVASFFEQLNHLDPKHRAPLLIQLPPNQKKNVAKLDDFLAQVREVAGSPWELAVEFRSDDWYAPETYRMLDRQNTALCIHDMMNAGPVDRPNDVEVVYVRRHGSGAGRYSGSYSPEQIARDAAAIREWLKEQRRVYVYYNNDIGGHALTNSVQLREALSEGRHLAA